MAAIPTTGTASLTRCAYRHGEPADSCEVCSAVRARDSIVCPGLHPGQSPFSPDGPGPTPAGSPRLACRQLAAAEAISARKLTVVCRPSDGQNRGDPSTELRTTIRRDPSATSAEGQRRRADTEERWARASRRYSARLQDGLNSALHVTRRCLLFNRQTQSERRPVISLTGDRRRDARGEHARRMFALRPLNDLTHDR